MAKVNTRKIGKKALAVLMAVTMIFSMVQMAVLAAGTAADPYDIGDVVYTADRSTPPSGETVAGAKWQYVKSHEAVWSCGREEHEHYFGCGSLLGRCSGEHDHQESGCTITAPERAEWKLVADVSNDKAEHLDIHINLTAKYTLNGKTYDASVILTGQDYTSGRLTITSTGDCHTITRHGDSVDAGQYRFHGTFPVGTYTNPVNYTIDLVKDVDFNVEGQTVTVPMTFSKTVNYWTDNICESLLAARDYKNGNWARGAFVGGHMDFQLGASSVTATPDPSEPDPSEPVKYTLTVQKNVSGIDLEKAKTYTFGIYSNGSRIDTLDITVAAGGKTALGTVALEENLEYSVVEEGDPNMEGYLLSTAVSIGSASAKSGTASDSFVLTGDTAVVFTNSYELPAPPPPPVTYDYTVVADYYTNGQKDNANAVVIDTVTGVQAIPAAISVATAYSAANTVYGENTYAYTGISQDGTVFILRYDRTYTPPTPPAPVTYDYTVVADYYTNGEKDNANAVVIDTVTGVEAIPAVISVAAAYSAANTVYGENTYAYTGISQDGTVFTLRYDRTYTPPAPVTYDYTVVADYYTNGEKDNANAVVIDTVTGVQAIPAAVSVAAAHSAANTVYGENTYAYTGISQDGTVFILRYDRTYTTPAPVTYDYTVVAEYYTNGQKDNANAVAIDAVTGVQAIPAAISVATAYSAANTVYGGNTYNYSGISQDGTVFTLRYDRTYTPPTPPAPVTYDYTVVAEYYTNGEKDNANAVVIDTVTGVEAIPAAISVAAAYSAANTVYGGNTYNYSGISQDGTVFTLRYDRTYTPPTPPTPPAPSGYSYHVVANYYTNGQKDNAEYVVLNFIAQAQSMPAASAIAEVYRANNAVYGGNDYDYTSISRSGAVYILRYDRTYTPAEEDVPPADIPGEDVPPADIPGEDVPPVDIPDEDVPLADLPEDEVPLADLPEEEVPLAEVPKTGDSIMLYLILTVLSAFGLAVLALGNRKTRSSELNG